MVDQVKVTFSVEGRPDAPGLRIKTINPIGLYVSSRDADAAQWYFGLVLVELAAKRGLFPSEWDGKFLLLKTLDWTNVLFKGCGEAIIEIVTPENIFPPHQEELMEPVLSKPPSPKLTMSWWKYPNGTDFCLVYDEGNTLDKWLLDAVKEDIKRGAPN